MLIGLRAIRFVAAVVLCILPASPVVADDLTMWTHPLGAVVELAGHTTLRGESPFPLDSRMDGRYVVRVEMAGYEEARGAIRLGTRNGELTLLPGVSNLRGERFFRSLAVPGWGQYHGGRRVPGMVWTIGAYSAALYALNSDAKQSTAHDEFLAKEAALAQVLQQTGPIAPGAVSTALLEASEAETRANSQLRRRNLVGIVTGALWGANLLDALVFHGGLNVSTGSDGLVQVGLQRKSLPRRFVRSLLFPGLGQSYSGRSGRGFIYGVAAIAAGAYAIDAHLEYKEEVDYVAAYGKAQSDLEGRGFLTPEQSAFYSGRKSSAESKAQDLEDKRLRWAAVTAGIWAASLLDAVLLGEPAESFGEGGTNIGFSTSPATGAPGLAVRYPF